LDYMMFKSEVLTILYIIMTTVLLLNFRKYPKTLKEGRKNISNNFNDKKRMIIIVLCTYFVYRLISYLFNIDIISAFTSHKNISNISFIGIFILIATSLLIEKDIDKRKNQ